MTTPSRQDLAQSSSLEELYGKLDENGFRKVVLALLLVSGATLVI